MTTIDIPAIRARVEAATKGPWTVIRDPKKPTRVLGIEYVVSHNHTPDAPCRDDGGADDCPASPYKDPDIVKTYSGCYPPKLGDAEFIASASQDVPALLALVDQMTRALVETEWPYDDDRQQGMCSWCNRTQGPQAGTPHQGGHAPSCHVDAALTQAGFPNAESRDAARRECCDAARKAADEGRRTGRDG